MSARLVRLASILALLLTLAISGRADAAELEQSIIGFVANSFADTERAIEGVAASGDPRALTILEALVDGRLFARRSDGAILVGKGGAGDQELLPVLGGASLGKLPTSDLEKVRINNRLRNQIQAAIGRLGLGSADPTKRLAAVDGLLRDRSSEVLDRLELALASETDATVQEAMRFGVAILELGGTDRARQLGAIAALSQSLDPRARQILEQASETGGDEEVRVAAREAVRKIEQNRIFVDIGVNLYQGLSLGSILLLAAMGLAITFGVMGVINMAHGEMLMLGAYSTFVVQEVFRAFLPAAAIDLYLVVAVPVAALVTGFVGYAVERGMIRFLYGRALETLLATWGLSLVLQQAVRSLFGPTNREVANPSWMTGGIEIAGGAVLTWNRLVIIGFSLVVLASVWAILRWSRFGLEMRAVTQNRSMAAAMGINTGRVDAMTFAMGSAVAGMGGVALSQVGNVSPNLGTLYIVDSFMVVVFGGVGQLAGTFAGAMTLGVVNKLLEPAAGAVLGKVLVLVLIILFIQKRPRGLFVLQGRSAES